ncbi:MAG: hypothetical protein M0027_17750, partial [Candidatus Dormibacteraeota bacterium]|nr:hypothetical protein [Candidatus Dormibacteraeota bacterium]
ESGLTGTRRSAFSASLRTASFMFAILAIEMAVARGWLPPNLRGIPFGGYHRAPAGAAVDGPRWRRGGKAG